MKLGRTASSRTRRAAVQLAGVVAMVAIAFLASARSAPPAYALFHLMKIDEIMSGVPGQPTVQFVELRMTDPGQVFTSGHTIKVYNSVGTEVGSTTLGNVANGADESTILIGTAGVFGFWGVNPDATMLATIPATGMVCFDAAPGIDCVPFGNYSAGNIAKGPASQLGPGNGTMSLKRVGDLPNVGVSNARLDFAYGCPTPKTNAGVTGVFSGGDPDGDGPQGCSDNCPADNGPQTNSDGNLIDLPPSKAFDDKTFVSADVDGDICDTDDDNDGRTDTLETTGGSCGSFSGIAATDKNDSDGDRTLDGVECVLGSNPTDALSTPVAGAGGADTDNDRLPDPLEAGLGAVVGVVDTDGDGILDGVEWRFYNSNPNSTNSDGDLCRDGREVASINEDTSVTSGDLSQVAQAFGSSLNPNYIVDFDTNKDGTITSADLSFTAQQFGSCP